MPLARGEFKINSVNTSGTPVALTNGWIMSANFFNTGAIPASGNDDPNRTYFVQVESTGSPFPITFSCDVGAVRSDPRIYMVRGYPELILAGTKFGVSSETIGMPPFQNSSTSVPYVDTTEAINRTGFPCFANKLPEVTLKIDASESNHQNSAERDVMAESWFHDVSQDTGQGAELIGTLQNIFGTASENSEHNNVLLEHMVHIAPVGGNGANDSANGTQNPAEHFATTIDIGGWRWEIWFGHNGHSPLVVYNRIGPAGQVPETNLSSEGTIEIDWANLLGFSMNNLENVLVASSSVGGNEAWYLPTHPEYPFSKMKVLNGCAISGVEFGVEPYLNSTDDSVYSLTLHNLELDVSSAPFFSIPVTDSIPADNVPPPPVGQVNVPVGGETEIDLNVSQVNHLSRQGIISVVSNVPFIVRGLRPGRVVIKLTLSDNSSLELPVNVT